MVIVQHSVSEWIWMKSPLQNQRLPYGQRGNGIFLHGQETNRDFLVKKFTFDFLFKWKIPIFSPNWIFGPFLPLWPSDIFLIWSENKKCDFFTKELLLIYWVMYFSGRKNYLQDYLKTTLENFVTAAHRGDFHSWLFWIPLGSPLTLR